MSKVPNHPPVQIEPGAVLGSDSLPFESLLFPNEPAANPAATTPDAGASRYTAGEDSARRLTETPSPAFPKLFRPKASN